MSKSTKNVRFSDSPSIVPFGTDSSSRGRRGLAEHNQANDYIPITGYRDDLKNNNDLLSLDGDQLENENILANHNSILQEQDYQLDALGLSIGRQRDLSIRIGEELDRQAFLLDDVHEHAGHHEGQLRGARSKLSRFSQEAKENLSTSVIVILIVILLLLIFILK